MRPGFYTAEQLQFYLETARSQKELSVMLGVPSSVYGFYIGDGRTSKMGSIELVCASEKDYDNFRLMELLEEGLRVPSMRRLGKISLLSIDFTSDLRLLTRCLIKVSINNTQN